MHRRATYWFSVSCAVWLSCANAWADNVVIIGTNGAANMATSLQNAGHTVTQYANAGPVDANALTGVDTVILLRTGGNAALSDFVTGGGLLITEWDGSEWALNIANLLNATDADFTSTIDAINFTTAGLDAGLGNGLGTSYSEANATDFFRTLINIGAGVDIYGTRNSNGNSAIIGGGSGEGFALIIGYDWGDNFTVGSNTDTLLHNALTLTPNVWDGSTDGTWSTGTNWLKDVAPGAGERVVFGGNVNTTVNHDQTAGTIYRAIVFKANSGSFTINGNSLGIAHGGSITNRSTNLQTIAVEVVADGNLTIDAVAGNISFSDSVSIGTGNTLTVTGAHDTTLSEILGTGALAKTGAGTLTLSGANTYTSGTNLGGGTVVLGNNSSLSNGDVTVSANSTIQSNDDARSIDNNFSVANGMTLTVNGNNNLAIGGNITGQGALVKDGVGTLALSGTNSYSGGTTVNGGTLEGTTDSIQGNIANNGIVNFNQDTDGTYAGNMSGTGLLSKQGTGTLTITGNHSQALGAVAFDGELKVDGSITGEVTIGPDAAISGTGTVGELNLYGRLAADNSIGTLNATGPATFNSDSTTVVEINGGGNVPGTNNDLLAATGAVQIHGGNVEVQAAAGTYTIGTQYTFLTGSSVTGNFDAITDNLSFFTAELGYTGTSAYFTLAVDNAALGNLAQTPNQNAVATYLGAQLAGATGDLQTVVSALVSLTDAEFRSALEQMSGEIYGTTQQTGIQNTTLVLHSLSEQLQPSSFSNGAGSEGFAAADTTSELNNSEIVQVSYQPDGSMRFDRVGRRNTTWVMGFGIGGDADSDGNAGRLDYGMGGSLVGVDTYVDSGHRLGVYGGYVATGLTTASPAATNDISGGQFGVYYTGRSGHDYYTLISGLQLDDYESERFVTAGGLNRIARGDYDGWQGFSYLERGVILYSNSRWSCQPFGALQYVHIRQNSFTETGADSLNLSVDGIDDDSFRSMVGIRSQVRTVSSRQHVLPEFRAMWVHEFLDTDSPVVARFATVGGAFVVEGLDMGRDWALVGTGLNYNLGRGWTAQANYDAQVNEHQAFHVGSGSIQKVW